LLTQRAFALFWNWSTEFLAATIEAQGVISEERLAEAFDRIDSDDSGYISAENLAEMLGSDFPKEEIDAIIREAGLTKDNQVSYAEFLALWETRHDQERADALRQLGDGPSRSESTGSLYDLNLTERVEIGEARASFLQAKHCTATDNNAKHVVKFMENTTETTII
jgi:hypothetical protein